MTAATPAEASGGAPVPAAALLLDLDGTILDTATDLTTAVNRTLDELGRSPVRETSVRAWIGDGVRALVRQALEATGGGSERDLDHAHERFMIHYGDCFADASTPYADVLETLAAFREAGVPMAVVTNKAAAFTEPLLEATGLRPLLDVVISGDSAPAKKPDPAPVLAALERMGAEPAASVLVGDSRNDTEAGLRAGCRVVCVAYGYNRGEDPHDLGGERVVDRFGDLRAVIRPAVEV